MSQPSRVARLDDYRPTTTQPLVPRPLPARAPARAPRNRAPRVINATATPTEARRSTGTPKSVYQWIRPYLLALAITAGAAAAIGVIWALVMAVMALITLITTVVTAIGAAITWVTAHWFAILVVVLALLFFGGKTASCAGIHCSGCKH